MKKIILFILVFLLIVPQIILVSAEDERVFVVIYQETNIRKQATQSSAQLERVPAGREFEIVGEEKDTDGKVWFKIVWKPDETAFVASWVVNVKTTKPPEKIDGKSVIIDPANKVNIRSSQSTGAEIVKVIKSRTVLPIIAQLKTPELWYQVDLGDGKSGWVKASVTKGVVSDDIKKNTVDGMVAHINPQVKIREQPTTNSRMITRTTSAIQPIVISKTTGVDDGMVWYEIELPTGQIGWVREDVSRLVKRETATSVSNLEAVIPVKLNVRKGAGTTFETIYRTKSEQRLKVISKLPDVNGDIWYQVKTEQGSGWVSGSHITLISTSEFNTVRNGARLLLSPSEGAKLIHTQNSEVNCGISGASINSENDKWYLITTSQEKTGWVQEKKLSIKGTVKMPSSLMIGKKVTIQRETNLAPFPSSDKGKNLFSSATGIVTATAIRDGGTLFYRISCGGEIGWVLAETTMKSHERTTTYAVNVGALKWMPRGEIFEFTIPVSMKPDVKCVNYKEDPRIVLSIKNGTSKELSENKKITNKLVSGVIVTPDNMANTLNFTFKLTSSAGHHMSYVSGNPSFIKLEIFEEPHEDELKLYIQGQPIHMNTPPFILEGKIMAPLLPIANKISGPVEMNKSEGIVTLQSERISLEFTAGKTKCKLTQPSETTTGYTGEDNQFVPSPRFVGEDEVFFVPLEQLVKHLDFKYYFFPNKKEIHLDPMIDRIEIGGCGSESTTCQAIETNISTIADYDSEELPDGRERITINNSFLISGAENDLDKNRVTIEKIERTVTSSSKVILYVVKRENERVSIGELRNPNRLIIQINERIKSGLAGKTITIDPGHGNMVINGIFDYGCVSPGGIKESELSLRIAKSLQKKLDEKGAKAVLTRNSENSENATLDDRVNQANSGGSQMFISIHTGFSRDPELQGCKTFFHAPLGERLAKYIQSSLVRATGFPDLGYWKRNFFTCRKVSGIPSVLIEPIFLSNKSSEQWAEEQKNIDKLTDKITDAITRYYEELP